MGAKTWMLVSSDGNAKDQLAGQPSLNRKASMELAKRLFPTADLEEGEEGSLSYTNPEDEEVLVGHFGNVAVVAAMEFGIDYPSKLPSHFLQNMPHPVIVLHAMHSAVDWFAFAVWENGKLRRALSLSPDSGILEDIGERFPFELPYWNGERRLESEDREGGYPFVFHPLELAEEALSFFYGYTLEGGAITEGVYDPEDVPLLSLSK